MLAEQGPNDRQVKSKPKTAAEEDAEQRAQAATIVEAVEDGNFEV